MVTEERAVKEEASAKRVAKLEWLEAASPEGGVSAPLAPPCGVKQQLILAMEEAQANIFSKMQRRSRPTRTWGPGCGSAMVPTMGARRS